MGKLVKKKDIQLSNLSESDKLDLITQHLIEYKEKNQHKIDFYNTVTQTEEWVEMAAVSKLLAYDGYGRNNLFNFLRMAGVLRNMQGIKDIHNTPKQEYVDQGYFKMVEQTYPDGIGNDRISFKTVVSQKGLEFIRRLIDGQINGE